MLTCAVEGSLELELALFDREHFRVLTVELHASLSRRRPFVDMRTSTETSVCLVLTNSSHHDGAAMITSHLVNVVASYLFNSGFLLHLEDASCGDGIADSGVCVGAHSCRQVVRGVTVARKHR